MELYYNLIQTYSIEQSNRKKAIEELNHFIEDNFLEEKEVVQIAVDNSTTILVEVEQDDGYSETILVNNLGEVSERLIFSLDTIEIEKEKVFNVGVNNYFDDEMVKVINDYMMEYNYTEREILNDKIEQFLLIKYENDKDKLASKLSQYHK